MGDAGNKPGDNGGGKVTLITWRLPLNVSLASCKCQPE